MGNGARPAERPIQQMPAALATVAVAAAVAAVAAVAVVVAAAEAERLGTAAAVSASNRRRRRQRQPEQGLMRWSWRPIRKPGDPRSKWAGGRRCWRGSGTSASARPWGVRQPGTRRRKRQLATE